MNETVIPEISPCPFCGNTKLKVESKHHGHHYYEGTHSATVRCSKCHARGPTASCKVEKGKYHTDEATNQKAIELWNARINYETNS
jgi:Lar family restriction alleviation protein